MQLPLRQPSVHPSVPSIFPFLRVEVKWNVAEEAAVKPALGCSGQVEICANTGGSGRQDHFLQADVRPRPLLHIFTVVMWLSS